MPRIAEVFMGGGITNKLIPTGPGRSISIRSAYGVVFDERDMPHALRIPGATVKVAPDYVERLTEWIAQCPERDPAVATLDLPGGQLVTSALYATVGPETMEAFAAGHVCPQCGGPKSKAAMRCATCAGSGRPPKVAWAQQAPDDAEIEAEAPLEPVEV